MTYIDLRSDTVTQPTEEMRSAMAGAVVGDDVYEDDPTVNRLEEIAAGAVRLEAALFVPSGTMGNQLAIMSHTKRGDEIIIGESYHVVAHEVGAAAILAGVSCRTVSAPDDIITAKQVESAIRPVDIHYPDTGLLCLENALSNGTVVPLSKMEEAYNVAKKHGIPVHLDGARLFNAAVYLDVPPSEITQFCDTVMFCLSKGLCSPIGSMLCGSKDFIKRARKYRKLLGGGMRQAGILAASGIISIEKMTKRLKDDHDNAKYLAEGLSAIPFVSLNKSAVQINIVFFEIAGQNFDHDGFSKYLLEKGIKHNAAENDEYRFVTHNDISRENIDFVLDVVNNFHGIAKP